MNGSYSFLPWVRRGLNRFVSGPLAEHGDLTIRAAVSGRPLTVDVHLFGPGHVLAIDPRAVVRTVPAADAADFETNLFPAIEFAASDFPWLFTPAGVESDAGGMPPWLVLITVLVQPGVSLSVSRDGQPAILTIAAPADARRELPTLAEAWAWAHTQVIAATSDDDVSLLAALADNSWRAQSRLVCPRRLAPRQRYLACVVPAFAAGVGSGLGEPVEAGVRPAWTDESSLRLPVYYSWSFATAEVGDFESLLDQLKPRSLGDVGRRPMDASSPGYGMPEAPGLLLGVEGALQPRAMAPDEWPEPARSRFRSALSVLIDRGERPTVVAPPRYGKWNGPRAPWMEELSLDPRLRVVAAAGAEVVRRNQEELVTAALEQAGRLGDANRIIGSAQLANLVSKRLRAKHLATLPDDGRFLQVTAPAHSRLRLAGGTTLRALSSRSAVPPSATSAALRRLSRPHGPLGRRLFASSPSMVAAKLNRGAIVPAPPRTLPDGAVAFNSLSPRLRYEQATQDAVIEAQQRWKQRSPVTRRRRNIRVDSLRRRERDDEPDLPDGPDDPIIDVFATASAAHQEYLQSIGVIPDTAPPPPLWDASLRPGVLEKMDAALARRIAAHVPVASDPFAVLPLELEFTSPMVDALAALSPELLVPALSRVPQDTVAVLTTNRRFVEAYLVGLNHEFAAELRWRRIPADPRATWFRRFWQGGRDAEVPPLREWRGVLGEHIQTQEPLVLLLRGALIRRYPNAAISAVAAEWNADGRTRAPGSRTLAPRFRIELGADTRVVGFDLTEAEMRGGPGAGWYVVIEEASSEPRFGLDSGTGEVRDPTTLHTWRDLSWDHVPPEETHVRLESRLTDVVADGVPWGRDAGEMAFITLQRPARVIIHASFFLGATT